MRGMPELLSPQGQSRRSLILVASAAAMTAWVGRAPLLAMRDVSGPDPFTLGVASVSYTHLTLPTTERV